MPTVCLNADFNWFGGTSAVNALNILLLRISHNMYVPIVYIYIYIGNTFTILIADCFIISYILLKK